MSDWKSVLKADSIDWLLEKDNPSVRYFTLTDILEKSENATEVKETKDEIMEIGAVPEILAKQKNEDYWETPKSFYTAKYKGTVWQLMILAELGADYVRIRIWKIYIFFAITTNRSALSPYSESSRPP